LDRRRYNEMRPEKMIDVIERLYAGVPMRILDENMGRMIVWMSYRALRWEGMAPQDAFKVLSEITCKAVDTLKSETFKDP